MILKKHFKKGDIDTKNNEGKKLIHVAVCGHVNISGRVNIIRELLKEKKSIIDDLDEKGYTALLYAIRFMKPEMKSGIVAFLVEQGANVGLGSTKDGIKPIHVAASQDMVGVVDLLLKNGANIDDTDKYGRTALHRAASEASLGMVKFLHIEGANIYAEDFKGRKPLDAAKADVAKKGGRKTIIEFLEKKFDIRRRNSSAATVVRTNSFGVSTRRKSCLPTSAERKGSLILSIFEQVRDKLYSWGEYTAEAVRVLEQLISTLRNNSPTIEREPLSPILREIPIESFTEVKDFLSLLRKLCCELEKQIANRLDYHKREEVLVLLDSLSRECTELKRNSNKSSLTPSVTELVHLSSNIDTVPRNISRSSQSSSFAHNGSVSDNVFVDRSLFFGQQDKSTYAPGFGHGSGRRSSFGSVSDNLIIRRAVYGILKRKNINIDLLGVDFTKELVEMVQDKIKSQSQSESQLSKKIDNEPKAHLSDLIRDPISIFSQIESYVNEGENEFETLLQHLRKEIQETCFNLKIGAAIGKGDCFFDSVAQALNELDGLTKDFNVKSLREDCANSCEIYKSEIINDAEKGGYFIAQKNYVFPELGVIKNGEDVLNIDETFNEYLKNIKKTAKEKEFPIWGRIDIEGKIIADKYNVQIKVIELHNKPVDGLYITNCEVGTGSNIVYILNYRNHFLPLLNGLKEDIDKKVDVSIEEVYGEKVSGQKEFNKNGSLEHQRSHSSTSFSDTASNSTESRDKGKILEGLQEIKDKIEGYNVGDEEGNYSEGYKEYIANVMEKMENLITAFRKEDWLTGLLKGQQEKVMFQEDLKLLHLIEEWISSFKDHVGRASLICALKPLTEIKHCFENGNLSYEMSQRFEKKLLDMITCCEGIGLSHDSEKEQQDHSTSDFGCSMPKFCEDEMFDCTLNNSRSLLRAKHIVKNEGTSKEGIDFVDCSFSLGISSFSSDDKDIFQPTRRMSRLFIHDGPSENKSSPISFKKAQEYLDEGNSDGAIKVYSDIVTRESLSGYKNRVALKALYNMAIVFLKEKKYSDAEEKFQKILNDVSLCSTDALHLVRNLASALCGQHKYGSALKKLQKVLDIHEEKLPSDHFSIVLIKNDIKKIQCYLGSSAKDLLLGHSSQQDNSLDNISTNMNGIQLEGLVASNSRN